jgi:hypothetical protein
MKNSHKNSPSTINGAAPSKPSAKILTFEAEPDVTAILDRAKALGMNETNLINACLRSFLRDAKREVRVNVTLRGEDNIMYIEKLAQIRGVDLPTLLAECVRCEAQRVVTLSKADFGKCAKAAALPEN